MKVLILGGGGTLGAFSAGALRALEASGWKPDACIGSSAGGINLLRSLVGGAEEAERFWTGIDWKTLARQVLAHNFVKDGLLDPVAFNARVDEGVDWARVLADPRPLGFIVVDLGTGRVSVRGNRTEKTPEDLRAVAHASYALPPLLPPVRVGGSQLADGGLLQNAPLETAMRMGATEIVYLCNVQVLPRQGYKRNWAPAALTRYLDIYFRRTSNVGFADAHIAEGRYRGVPFLTVAPPASLEMRSMFSWMLPTPRVMAQLVRHGEAYAREALSRAGEHGDRVARHGAAAPEFARTGVGAA